jgi:hypothetical protein
VRAAGPRKQTAFLRCAQGQHRSARAANSMKPRQIQRRDDQSKRGGRRGETGLLRRREPQGQRPSHFRGLVSYLAQDIGRARIPRRGTQFRNSGILKILRIEEFRSAKIRAGPDCLLGTDKGCRLKPDSRSCPPAQLLPQGTVKRTAREVRYRH